MTMTTQQLADWCAEKMGYTKVDIWNWKSPAGDFCPHPYLTNLGGAEKAWRDLCEPHDLVWSRDGGLWSAHHKDTDSLYAIKRVRDTGNWTHDFFTLIKLCREVREGRTT